MILRRATDQLISARVDLENIFSSSLLNSTSLTISFDFLKLDLLEFSFVSVSFSNSEAV